MLQKLRVKLILINVLSLSLVLLILFSLVYVVVYRILVNKEDTLLRKVAAEENYNISFHEYDEYESDETDEADIKNPNFYESTNMGEHDDTQMLSLFYVKKNKAGVVFQISPNIFADVENIMYLINKVDEIDKSYLKKGKIDIGEVQLSYLVEQKEYGSIYIFTDRSSRENFVRSFLWISVFGFVFTIVTVFFISMIISKKAIQPIKEAIEDQDKFIADASHELRTPLAVIRSNIELVLDSPDMTVEENSKWLNYIHKEAKRMTKMTENFLLLSKTSTNTSKYDSKKNKNRKQKSDDEEFSLSEVIENICDNFKPLVNTNGFEFRKEIQPDINFYASKERISQLMSIFIDNAIKYTKDGEIAVSLHADENKINIKIKDTGIGIKKEDQSKIFERFYRVEKSRSRALGGSGLGLSIAQNIVSEYGGKISVESKYEEEADDTENMTKTSIPETGTEFTITFDRKKNR